MLKNLSKICTQNNILRQPERLKMQSVTFNFNQFIKVDISGDSLMFPYSWLRENCQCDKCFHQTAKSRIIDWKSFNIDIKPKTVVNTSKALNITWEDDHQSSYTFNWLKLRSFDPKYQKKYSESIFKPKKVTWSGEDFEKVCGKHDYNEILKSDHALHDWLEHLAIYGVAFIENAPLDESALDNLMDLIGFPKQTHYGVKFVIQNVPNTNNVAYLSADLPLHVDLPYYEYYPGVSTLHCQVQTESKGGESLLSDAQYTANFIKEHHPEQFKLLTELEVEWSDIGEEKGNQFFKLTREPVITLDRHGEISKIRFSIPQRGSNFPFDISYVNPWYQAHRLFFNLNNKFAAKFKIKTGEILFFDNTRLLHGRTKYEDSSENVRKLIGSYLDWDEIFSRLRSLKVKLNKISGIENK